MSESAPQPGDTVTVGGITHRDGSPLVFPVLGHRKRGGRKPGSKNRPKTDQAKEVAKLKARIVELEALPPPKPVTGAEPVIALLERAIAIRISAMDSESRLTAKIRELQAIASEAVQMLRASR